VPTRIEDTLYEKLPATYRLEDETTFLKRLLSLFGEVLDGLEDTVYGVRHQLSPQRCDEKFLPWLASWVALTLDETWDTSKRRALIARAITLFATRGTIPGLKEFVEVYTGLKPEIHEEFGAAWRVGVRSTVGLDTRVYGTWAENAHRFAVVINLFETLPETLLAKLKRVVEENKPAHTQVVEYRTFVAFWLVGVRSTVGVDTKVGG
jgi:phage tail-like protein